jgi:hypothetical protein
MLDFMGKECVSGFLYGSSHHELVSNVFVQISVVVEVLSDMKSTG